jgi:hypothetical protein
MGLDQRLTEDQKRAAQEAAKEPYYAEEADWLVYKEREKKPWLNKDKGVFEETDKSSLNRRLSVFEATAVFDTKETRKHGDEVR